MTYRGCFGEAHGGIVSVSSPGYLNYSPQITMEACYNQTALHACSIEQGIADFVEDGVRNCLGTNTIYELQAGKRGHDAVTISMKPAQSRLANLDV